jgi:hypothetical protein
VAATAAAAWAALLLLFAGSGTAAAEEKAQCRILTIHATNKEGKTDDKLKDMAILKKAPFASYATFLLISDKTHALAAGASVGLSLPAGSELSGKLSFRGANAALKELNFRLAMMKEKAKEPEEIDFAVRGKAPFLYVRPFKDGLLLLHFQCHAL